MIVIFYVVILPLTLLVVPTLAGIYLARARARRDLLHEPRCRHCQAPIGFEVATGFAACAGCQRPVSESGEPIAGRRPGRILPLALSVTALVSCWVIAVVAAQLASRTMSTRAGIGVRSTSQIMSEALAGQSIFVGDAIELRRRSKAGEDVVDVAREQLSAAIDLRARTSADGRLDALPPVANSEGPAHVAAIALLGPGTLTGDLSDTPGDLAEPSIQELARKTLIACFPRLVLEHSAHVGGGVTLRRTYTGFEPNNGELRRVVVVTSVEIDGTPVPFESLGSSDPAAPVLLRVDRPIRLPSAHASSGQTARVHCRLHLYDGLDADRIADARGSLLPLDRWPSPIATSDITVDVKLAAAPDAPNRANP